MVNLVADIGGTNVRFAHSEADGLSAPISCLCADFPSLEAAIAEYITQHSLPSPHRMGLAVAGPVSEDRVDLSNNDWSFSKQQIKTQFSLSQLTVINDFTAQALSVPDAPKDRLICLRAGRPVENSPIAVLGPGTGLGFSALIDTGTDMLPLETEGGQIGLSAQTKQEEALIAHIRDSLSSDSHSRLVAEDVLSGRGLETLYQHFASPPSLINAAEIVRLAGQSDPHATDAIIQFLNFLGSYIANAILMLGARHSVYICGGITPHLASFIDKSQFIERISQHDKFSDFISDVPVYLLDDPHSGVRGAAAALDNGTLGHRHI